MKIGILTYHRAENYGALLQAYATMSYLCSLGHDVSFVDYWPKYHSDYFRLFPWQQSRRWGLLQKTKFLGKLVFFSIPRMVRKYKMQKFMTERLGLPKNPRYDHDEKTDFYDVVVYGSDQIWRKQNLGGVLFDDWYFGSENVVAYKKIVYAGSMGTVDVNQQEEDYFRTMMSNFSSISVREIDLQVYLNHLGVPSSLVIDPVFLLSKEQWKTLIKEKHSMGKYILFYNLLNTQESVRFAEGLSKTMNLPIREVNKRMSYSHLGRRYSMTASVEQFLQLIDGAECIVSNSFHGVAMSIVFQKQFYAVGMGKRANRVLSLLDNLHIKERYIKDVNTILLLEEIDYQQVDKYLINIVEKSKVYIHESIS